jgi:hypothetical protein
MANIWKPAVFQGKGKKSDYFEGWYFKLVSHNEYKGIGKWKDYLYGERVYIILSLVAKTILAWLVFIGIYAPF